ncbi:hypothetical protein AB0F18_11215 [Streptomyces sp. NPDC029216]|uniref:hypothetical protein n=1 Tax=Streptomyces sp. NPDC029216 TaxID=3154701 RepID=UPI0033DDA266
MARYRDYVRNDLIPAFGTLKLDQLAHRHISAFVTSELAAGRGKTTLYRCLATLSSALGDAVRQHRLAHNPASPPALHRPPSPERQIWTAAEAVRFLQHCHQADTEMADLFEFSSSPARRPVPARTGSPSHPASPPPSNTGPDQGPTPTATRSPDSSSADPTASRCGPTPSSTGSGSCPKKPACHG